MAALTEDGRKIVHDLAKRHDVSPDAVQHLLIAMVAGGGRQAQFNHPDLSGMGQWSQGGMIMVGDMFNNQLKARVDALCNDLAAVLQSGGQVTAKMSHSQSQSQSSGNSGASGGASLFVSDSTQSAWPEELGSPSSVGSQNDLHYAVFPDTRRLAIRRNGETTIYDTGDHRITGFSQQQGGGQSLTFTSQHGLVRLDELKQVSPGSSEARPEQKPESKAEPAPAAEQQAQPAPAATSGDSDDAIFSRIEKLAELRKKDIITAEEFDAKKAELLSRL